MFGLSDPDNYRDYRDRDRMIRTVRFSDGFAE